MLQQEVSVRANAVTTMSAASLRELVIESALEILDRDGLGLRPDSIGYAKVFAYLEEEYSIKVTRGSVHERIWDTQDDFRRDVLGEALDFYPVTIRARDELSSQEAFQQFVGDHPDREQRSVEFARNVGNRLWEDAISSPVFKQIQSLKAIASRFNDPFASEVLHATMARRSETRLQSRRQLMASAATLLERRVKHEFGLAQSEGYELIYLLNMTLTVGGHLNGQAGCRDLGSPVELRSDVDSGSSPHSIAAVAFRAVLDYLTELVPDGEGGGAAATADLDLPPIEPSPVQPDVSAVEVAGQRRSREQLKRLVLSAGLELLLKDGLALKPESIRYAAVLANIKKRHGITISRASVHGRLWASHREFCHEVLARSVRLGSGGRATAAVNMGLHPDGSRSFAAGSPVSFGSLDALAHDGDGSLPDVAEVFRLALENWLDALADSPRYRRRLIIKASLLAQSDASGMEELRLAIQETDRSGTDLIERFVRERFLPAGYMVKPELGLSTDEAIELTGTLVQAMGIGVVFNRLCGISTVSRKYRIRRSDGSGQFDDWSPAGIAVKAYFEFLFCRNPVAVPS